MDGLRCWGINDGCCTKENPCEKGDGDCDNDEQCAGGLTCGKDNCGWHHMDKSDDCCMGEKSKRSFIKQDEPSIQGGGTIRIQGNSLHPCFGGKTQLDLACRQKIHF